MLTYIIIGGVIWFGAALLLTLAIALAARKQVSPVSPAEEVPAVEPISPSRSGAASEPKSLPLQQPVPHPATQV